jgi:hypothetical protein
MRLEVRLTVCRREPDSNPRSHPTALAAAHIGRCSFRRPDAFQQRRPPTARATRIRLASIVGPGYIVRELRYFRPVRPKRPASTSGTTSSNPLSSSGESANPRSLSSVVLALIGTAVPPAEVSPSSRPNRTNSAPSCPTACRWPQTPILAGLAWEEPAVPSDLKALLAPFPSAE